MMFKMLALKPFRSKAKGLTDLLNYAAVVAPGVVQCKDGSFLAGFWYRGPDTISSSVEELDMLSQQANRALSMFGTGWAIWVDAVRVPASAYPARSASSFPEPISALIEEEWRAKFDQVSDSQVGYFETRYAMILQYTPPSRTSRRVVDLFYSDSTDQTGDPVGYMDRLLTGFQLQLDRFVDAINRSLPIVRMDSRVGVSHGTGREVWNEELVDFLYWCVSGQFIALNLPTDGSYLDGLFAVADLYGGERPRLGREHILVVALTGFPLESSADMLGELDRLPFAYRFSTRFISRDTHESKGDINALRKRWGSKSRGFSDQIQGTTKGPVSESDMLRHNEAAEALSKAEEGAVTFGYYTPQIVLRGSDLVALELRGRELVSLLGKAGFSARVEDMNSMEAWLGSLPGHTVYNLRRPLVHTQNLADLLALSSVWPGHKSNPCPFYPEASPPLMQVETDGSTPFRFSLHVGDVGHTMILGPTGTGKSVLLTAIMAQHFRYPNAQVFAFDKGMSAFALCKAMGGAHFEIGVSGGGAFAPLANLKTEADFSWAAEFIESLFLLQVSRAPSPGQRAEIYRAVVQLQTDSGRSMSDFVATVQDSMIKEALGYYCMGGAAGSLLDSMRDEVTLADFTVFEIEELMAMGPKAVLPVFLYIDFLIRRRLDGRPTLLVIDEAWVLLGHPVFRDKLVEWLKVLRKANVAVVVATQSVADFANSGVSSQINENTPTHIYLANPDATRRGTEQAPGPADLYSGLGASPSEIAVIAQLQRKREYYVTSIEGKRRMDLRLGPIALAFLAVSDKPSIARIRELIRQEGATWPYAWLAERGVSVKEQRRLVRENAI